MDNQLSTRTVAEQFGISTGHLSRLVKAHLGITFLDYVKDKKLREAARLLVDEPDMHVRDIARHLGYSTPAYFAKIFRREYGMSPKDYRQRKLTLGNTVKDVGKRLVLPTSNHFYP